MLRKYAAVDLHGSLLYSLLELGDLFEHIGLPYLVKPERGHKKLSVADCTTLIGNVTRTGDIRKKTIWKSAPGMKISVEWSGFYLYTVVGILCGLRLRRDCHRSHDCSSCLRDRQSLPQEIS